MSKLTPGDRVSVDAGLGITKTGNVQRITESTVFVKHYNGSVVGYRTQHVTKMISEQAAVKPRGVGLKSEFDAFKQVMEKTLTPAELKKREEVAKAIERENPGMDMSKKMAIATATAKKVAEEAEQIDELKKSTVKSYANKKQAELDDVPSYPFKKPAMSKAETEKAAKGMMGALARMSGKKPTSEEAKTHTVPKTAKEKDLAAMAHPKDKITHADVMVGRGVKKEDVHYCAKHVFSERFGEGMVVEGQHAEPNEQGLIEWYDVDFGGTVRRVMTEKVKVMHAEYHMNHKKKMKEEDEIEVEDEDDKKEMKEMSSKEKMKRGLYNKEETEQIDEKITIDSKGNRVDNSVKLQPHAAASKTDASVTAYYAKLKAERDKKKQSEMGEELKGNQHKIDKNKNGKIDAHDFKLLRKESVLDEGFRDAVLKTTAKNQDDNDVHVTTLRNAGLHASQGAGANNHIIVPPEHEKKARELLSKHLKEETEQIDEKLTDDAKQKIQTALGPKFSNNTLRKTSGPARAIIGLAKTNPNNIVKKEEVEINEAETGNLPGQSTHIMNKDVRHPEHGIISNGTVLRHTGGSNFEVRAGRAKGKIVNIPKDHVNKLDEEVEQIDEISAELATKFQKGRAQQALDAAKRGDVKTAQTRLGAATYAKNYADKKKAKDQGVKEDVDLEEAMISYSDFQSKIDSHRKAGNQIKDDKYDKKKASYTVVDQEGTAKKITHTDAGVSQQHLGSMKRDDSDDKSAETKPKETRGRGRPAGSKSGARN
jgi:hypothetical protein